MSHDDKIKENIFKLKLSRQKAHEALRPDGQEVNPDCCVLACPDLEPGKQLDTRHFEDDNGLFRLQFRMCTWTCLYGCGLALVADTRAPHDRSTGHYYEIARISDDWSSVRYYCDFQTQRPRRIIIGMFDFRNGSLPPVMDTFRLSDVERWLLKHTNLLPDLIRIILHQYLAHPLAHPLPLPLPLSPLQKS